MRAYQFAIAAFAASIAGASMAQDFGGLARAALRTAARERPDRSPQSSSVRGGAARPASAESTGSGVVVAEDMPVISSDGVRVAVVKHTQTGGTTYAADRTFFTADRYYSLRRIYGREATVRGGAVHLKMTAAQFRARGQNPE